MTLSEAFTIRFDELLKKRNISAYKFLKANCIARSTINNIRKGNTKSPTLALIYQVSKGFGISHLEFLCHPVFFRDDIDFM